VRETIEDIVAEGDRVVYRWTVHATHVGEVMGIQGTGTPITFGGIEIYRLRDGRIVERWGVFDQLALLRQVGAMPSKPGAPGP
jgi:predicted ester cyclase